MLLETRFNPQIVTSKVFAELFSDDPSILFQISILNHYMNEGSKKYFSIIYIFEVMMSSWDDNLIDVAESSSPKFSRLNERKPKFCRDIPVKKSMIKNGSYEIPLLFFKFTGHSWGEDLSQL